jgi:two-component sensor histidine kinase
MLFSSLQSSQIKITDVASDTQILRYADYFIDINSKNNFTYIKSHPNIFKRYNKDFISQGYSKNTIWLMFSITNNTTKPILKILKIDNSMLDEISLYTRNNDSKYTQNKKGVQYRNSFDSFLRFKFEINLNPDETKQYFLKTKSLTSGLYFHLSLLNKQDYYIQDIDYQHILMLFFGAMLALTIYNLFIYFFTKEKSYLYYVAYMVFTIIMHMSFTSMNLYFLPIKFDSISSYLSPIYMGLTSIFVILFTREFLNFSKYKKIDLSSKVVIVLNILLPIIVTIFSDTLDIMTFFAILSIVYIFCISIYLVLQKNANAKYFMIGWFISLFGYIMLGFKQANLPSLLDYFPYFFEFSILTEAFLFSFILSKKLNQTKELKNSLNTNKILLKELHHRVKNNMQFIILLYRLKLSNIKSDILEEKLNEVEISIQAMSTTHELLYNQKNSSNINTNDFFIDLIKQIKNSYSTQTIQINTLIKTSLNIDQSAYCAIILNELLTNSFKYAFKDNHNGKIDIQLIKQDKKYHLSIQDNGIGFDYKEKINSSFGLNFIRAIVQDKLNGTINFNTKNGTHVLIII